LTIVAFSGNFKASFDSSAISPQKTEGRSGTKPPKEKRNNPVCKYDGTSKTDPRAFSQ
jgi:hypothetical protein